jgi:7-keto-8-aminopelargonate synthetase-like enzyme
VPHGNPELLYENVFQNSTIFPTQVSLSPEQGKAYTAILHLNKQTNKQTNKQQKKKKKIQKRLKNCKYFDFLRLFEDAKPVLIIIIGHCNHNEQ